MRITIVGTGDAYATDRVNSSILVESEEYQLLIDCGPTVPQALWRTTKWQEIDSIYFTHLHPDHTLGLTTLINRYNSAGRTRPLELYFHSGKGERLQQLVEYGFWPDVQGFEVLFREWSLSLSAKMIGPFSCQTAVTRHAATNHSLSLKTEMGSLFYSGDGRVLEECAALISGCDLAFIECLAATLPEAAGHSDLVHARTLANAHPNTRFLLYHIDCTEFSELEAGVLTTQNMEIAQEANVIILNQRAS